MQYLTAYTRSWFAALIVALVLLVPVRTFADDATTTDDSAATSTIATGDAGAVSETDNQVNTDIVSLNTPGAALTDDSDSATNTATTTNAVDTEAVTGDNTASSTDPVEGDAASASTTITTGDAFASADILNEINTNIVDSNGMFFFLNNLFGPLSTLNFSDFTLTPSSSCNCSTGDTASTTITNSNTVSLVNSAIVVADTGGNTAAGNGASISTGNATAEANVVNVANTNIVNSTYLLMVVNNAADWNGDLVLPNSAFFSNFLAPSPCNCAANVNATDTNVADITNDISTTAESGGNTATLTDASSTIATGQSVAASTVYNQANTNLFGSASVMMLFRIFGNWTGSVFNAPAGISWAQTPSGVQVWGGGSGESASSTSDGASSLNVSNANSASIANNVSVYALTGANEASSTGAAAITTGNALALSNVVNLANTNIIGHNWILAIFNIFGNWNGSISFGQPDLWVGASVKTAEGVLGPGGALEYVLTVTNKGDADAHNVMLSNIFNSPFLTFDDQTGAADPNTSDMSYSFNIGTVAAGQTVTVEYPATVGSVPSGQTTIDDLVAVKEDEPDHGTAGNTDEVSIVAVNQNDTSGGVYVPLTPDPILGITKTAKDPAITASSTEDYTVTVHNSGGPAYHATLVDTLENDKGDTIATNTWDLGTIDASTTIQVSYTLFFDASTTPGGYINISQVHAEGRNPSLDPFYGWFADSPVATATVTVLGDNSSWNLAITATTTPIYSLGIIEKSKPAPIVALASYPASIPPHVSAPAAPALPDLPNVPAVPAVPVVPVAPVAPVEPIDLSASAIRALGASSWMPAIDFGDFFLHIQSFSQVFRSFSFR